MSIASHPTFTVAGKNICACAYCHLYQAQVLASGGFV
jgi:hypothetical protein